VIAALARPSAPDVPLLSDPAWAVARAPMGHVLELTAVGLLAPALRERFGLRWSRARELELRALGATMRAGTPLMPSWLKNSGELYLRYRAQALARGEVASPERLTARASPAQQRRTPA
jgi:uncharacterized protein (DUF2236 family)